MKYPHIDFKGKVTQRKPFLLTGTSLMGQVDCTYKQLVEVFGEPNEQTDGYKVDAEWAIFTPDGIASIYNYKDGKNYLGDEGLDVEEITEWHIGGKSERVVIWIEMALFDSYDKEKRKTEGL